MQDNHNENNDVEVKEEQNMAPPEDAEEAAEFSQSDAPDSTDAEDAPAEQDNEAEDSDAENTGSEETAIEVSDAGEEGEDAVEVSNAEDEEEEIVPYVPKLSEKQQKIWQTVMGIVCGFAVWLSLALGSIDPDNTLLRWLFLIVFVAIMVIRTQIEKRTGVILRTFMKYFLIGLVIFLGVYLIYGFASGTPFMQE